jgi:PAS domain S-box-containing protein
MLDNTQTFMEETLVKSEDMKTRILYIDSDKGYRDRTRRFFENSDYRCSMGIHGLSSLEKIILEKPDLVIVDYFLDDVTGDELYTRFLLDPRFREFRTIPFILLTNNGKVNKAQMYNLGFSACLSKPFRSKELLEFVEDVLVTHQLKLKETLFWETIQESKNFLEKVVESSVDAIITTDRRGVVTYCNKSCEDLLGYRFDELLGLRVDRLLEKESSELLEICSILNKRRKVQNFKTWVKTKEGTSIPINLSVSNMHDGSGRVMGTLVICQVVGGEHFKEFDKYESDRLSAVIETAVAVNHAVNNPLVPILGNAQFLLQSEDLSNEDVRKRLRIIVKNALRIRDITKKLASITNPVTKEYLRGTRMLDIEASAK